MPWGIAAAAVVGAVAQDRASDKAAGAATKGANASIAEQRMAREQYRSDIQPYMQSGTNALNQLNALNRGDFSSFQESPDYRFRFDSGLQALDRSAAARGALNAGGTDADRMAYGQGMASQAYGDYYNRLNNLAAMGQNAIAGQGTMAQNTATNIGNLTMAGANAQGNAAINSANAWSGALNNMAGAWGAYQGRQSGYGG